MLQQHKTWWIILIFAFSGICGLMVSIYQNPRPEKLPSKQIETFHYPALFVEQLKNDKRAGEKIFTEFCASCHSDVPKIDINAPRLHEKKVWRGLSHIPMQTLLQITIDGKGAMPARGGCFECSDAQLEATVRYILDTALAS